MKRIFWMVMFFFLHSASVFAMSADEMKDLLTPHKEDAAIQYLGFIFGTVSPSLADRGLDGNSQVFGQMMGVLNQIAEVVGILLLIYIIIVGTINTASSGKMLGEKWNGTWLPMRSALGIALLVPGKASYCLAQVMVMWVVYYGVGAASHLWAVTVNYLNGNNIYSSSGMSDAHLTNLDNAKAGAVVIYKNLICNAWHTAHGDATPFSYAVDKSNPTTINFGYAYNDKGIQNQCGAIHFDDPLQASYVIRLANDFQASASKYMADKKVPDTNTEIRTIVNQYVSDMETLKASQQNTQGGTVNGMMTTYRNNGWLLAGNYYRELMKDRTADGATVTFPTESISTTNSHGPCDDLAGDDSLNCAKDVAAGSAEFSKKLDQIVSDFKNSKGIPGAATDNIKANSSSPPVWFYTFGVATGIVGLIHAYIDFFGAFTFQHAGDPFFHLVTIGQHLMQSATDLIAISLVGGTAIFMAIAGICGAQSPMGAVGQTVQSVVASLVMGLAGFAYTQGVMLAIYLPLIPCMIFLVGAVGWFISVIEAMVAAPIVALGLLWPDAQNEVLGRAEPAMMLLLNLFLRPSLMVVGLVSGILLCWISFKLLHQAFQTVIDTSSLGMDFGFSWLALGFIYATMSLALAKKSFSMIHVIPDKVMAWIGDHSQGHGQADEIMGTLNSGAERAGGNISGISSGVGQYLGYGGQDIANKLREWRLNRAAKNNQLSVGDGK